MTNNDIPENRRAALTLLLSCVTPRPAMATRPWEALRCCLDMDVYSWQAVPAHPKALRDGYAFLSDDTAAATEEAPISLRISGHLVAESDSSVVLRPGTAVRVLTGSPIPAGADCVVPDEVACIADKNMHFTAPAIVGRYILPMGSDLAAHEHIAEKGDVVTPQMAAVLVNSRLESIMVRQRPRAAMFALGNELTDPRYPDIPGHTPANNIILASGLMELAGFEMVRRGVLPDNVETIVAALAEEPTPELIVTTGGTGKSERDMARRSAIAAGFKMIFPSVGMQPGKGMFAAIRNSTILLGLPGPTHAVFSCLHAFVPELAAKLADRELPEPKTAFLTASLRPPEIGDILVPCRLSRSNSIFTADPFENCDISPLAKLARAHGVLLLEKGQPCSAGEQVTVLTLAD